MKKTTVGLKQLLALTGSGPHELEATRRPVPSPTSPDLVEPPNFQAFPSFPTVDQLLDHQEGRAPHPLLQLTEMSPAKETSLFEGLLNGRADYLIQDATDHPERYDDETKQLLAELGTGTRKMADLHSSGKRLLDRATLDFATFRSPDAPKPKAAPKPVTAAKRPSLLATELTMEGTEPGPEAPPGELAPFWWL